MWDQAAAESRPREIPGTTVARLPLYQRALARLATEGTATVSSAQLAELAGVTSAKVRKDLSRLGSYGVRGVGYDVAYLQHQIRHGLGLTEDWRVIIVGAGKLGRALAAYAGMTGRGFTVVAAVDTDPRVAGDRVGPAGVEVRPLHELERLVADLTPEIAVIATPGEAAQQVCDRLVACGIGGILNFAPAVLTAPDDVLVRKVDLAVELQVLAFHCQRRRGAAAGVDLRTPLARGEALP